VDNGLIRPEFSSSNAGRSRLTIIIFSGGGGGIAAYGGDSYRQGTGGADGIVVIQYQYDFERNGLIFILK
jgi:hypothetical protein